MHKTRLKHLIRRLRNYFHTYDAEVNVLIMFILICVYIISKTISLISYFPIDASVMLGLNTEDYISDMWHLLSYIFAHDSLVHLLGNLYVIFLVGDNLERALGSRKYLVLFIFSGLVGGLTYYHIYGYLIGGYGTLIGASASVYGVIGALLFLLLTNDGELEELTISSVSIYILYLVIISISSSLGQNIAHWSGFLAGFLICMIAVKISSRPLVTFDRMLTRIGADCRKIYYEPSEGDYEKICAIAEQIFSDPSGWNELYSELEKQKPAESEYIPDRFTIDKKALSESALILLNVFVENDILSETEEGCYIVKEDSKEKDENEPSLFVRYLSHKGIWSELYTYINLKNTIKYTKLGIPIDLDVDGDADFFVDLMYFEGSTPVFVNCPLRPVTNLDCYALDSVVNRFQVSKAKKVIVLFYDNKISNDIKILCKRLNVSIMYYREFFEKINKGRL